MIPRLHSELIALRSASWLQLVRLERDNKREFSDYDVADAMDALGNLWLARAADIEEAFWDDLVSE